MSAKSPSPIDLIHRAGWGKTARTKRDAHQIKPLGELLKTPPGEGARVVEGAGPRVALRRARGRDDCRGAASSWATT